MAQRKPITNKQPRKPKSAPPAKAAEPHGLRVVIVANLLNMLCVGLVAATVLAALLGARKWV
jgi:hypothetical protein